MTEIEMKIKEHTEPLENACKKMAKHLESCLEQGINDADATEVGTVADAIKDLAEAKEKTIKGLYYTQIMEAMKENDYGEDYDEDGRMYYRGRNKRNGQYMHRPYTESMPGNNSSGSGGMGGNSGSGGSQGGGRGYDEPMRKGYEARVHMRDMDRNEGRMYSTEDTDPSGYERAYQRGFEEGMSHGGGRMEHLRKGYEEAKEAKDKDARIERLTEMVNNMTEEFTPLIKEMDVTEKSILRNGLQALQNKIS